MIDDPSRGKLVILSGPSGVGKSTLVRRLIQECPIELVLSVSATTRAKRLGETDGVDYHFLTDRDFQQQRDRGEFLEFCEVFGRGHLYGTLVSEVTPSLEAGKWVLLEIDVQGAEKVRARHPDAVTIFICPESFEQLKNRLWERGTDTPEAMQDRLTVARRELDQADSYDFQVVNDRVDRAVQELCEILIQQG